MAVLVGCVAAAFSDFLDGYIARNYNQKVSDFVHFKLILNYTQSNLGSFLDPLADKIFIGSIGAGLASQNIIPIELFGTIVARDVTIVGIAFALRAWEKPTNAGFFDFTKTTIDFVPSNLSKVMVLCNEWHHINILIYQYCYINIDSCIITYMNICNNNIMQVMP